MRNIASRMMPSQPIITANYANYHRQQLRGVFFLRKIPEDCFIAEPGRITRTSGYFHRRVLRSTGRIDRLGDDNQRDGS